MSKDEKARTSITLSETALETARKRFRELGYGSLSEMLEALILQDAAEKRDHIVVRSPDGIRYTTKGDTDRNPSGSTIGSVVKSHLSKKKAAAEKKAKGIENS